MSKAGVQYGLFGWLESGIADIQSLSVHFRFVPKADSQLSLEFNKFRLLFPVPLENSITL